MFNKLPSLTSLRAFEAASRLLSFKAAANELNVSPTAISHQIRGLEAHLNLTLFERKTRAVVLTEDGERLALATHSLMKGLLDTVNELTAAPKRLTIGTTNAFAAMWLVPNLEHFRRQYPNVDVAIRAEDTLMDIENDRRVDMVIRSGHFDASQKHAILLLKETLGFFATPAYWQQQKPLGQSIFFCTQWKNRTLLDPNVLSVLQTLCPTTPSFNIRTFDDENQTIQAALSGQGIAIVSHMLVKGPVSQGWLAENSTLPTLPGLDHYCVRPNRNLHHSAAIQMERWLISMFSGVQ